MFSRIFCTLVIVLTTIKQLKTETTLESTPRPQLEETLMQALAQGERILTECILSNAEINITYHGTSSIPLDDLNIEFGNVALVHLYNLRLTSSPFHMIGITPHLRLMNLELYANISLLHVTGNYTISPEIMNYTQSDLISTEEGTLNLTFHDVEISGTVGLNINLNHFYIHTVDLNYRPLTVVLTIKFKDGGGQEQMMEERRHNVRNSIEEPVYKDLADRLNSVLLEQLNAVLANVSIPDLLENNNDTEISFRTIANNHIGNINDFVDTILDVLKENLTDEIHIPNLQKSFERKIGFFRFRGIFLAEEGWLKGLKTLHRIGNVTIRTVDNGIEVSAALGLSMMQFGYNRYMAKFSKVGPRGDIRATVGQNSVSLRGRVSYVDNNCTVTLEELKVNIISNIEMMLTGLNPFNWILSKVVTTLINRSKINIITNIEHTIGNKIRSQLQTFDCSSFFPESAVSNPQIVAV